MQIHMQMKSAYPFHPLHYSSFTLHASFLVLAISLSLHGPLTLQTPDVFFWIDLQSVTSQLRGAEDTISGKYPVISRETFYNLMKNVPYNIPKCKDDNKGLFRHNTFMR